MNKLLAMEVFVQVVDAGGFTRAAEHVPDRHDQIC